MTYNLLAYLYFLEMEYEIFNYGPSGSSRVVNFCLLVVDHQLLHIPVHFSQSTMPEELAAEEDGIGLFSPYSTPTLTKYYH
jgi:hypothetical protein